MKKIIYFNIIYLECSEKM